MIPFMVLMSDTFNLGNEELTLNRGEYMELMVPAFLCSYRAAAGWAEGPGHHCAVVCGQRVGACCPTGGSWARG